MKTTGGHQKRADSTKAYEIRLCEPIYHRSKYGVGSLRIFSFLLKAIKVKRPKTDLFVRLETKKEDPEIQWSPHEAR